MNHFQSESKTSGDTYEKDMISLIKSQGHTIVERSKTYQDYGVEIDAIIYNTVEKREEHCEFKGGRKAHNKNPGAQRTDNVKKAIANAAILKVGYPNIYFVIYFSVPPIPNSASDNMLKVALKAEIINEIRYHYYSNNDAVIDSLFEIE